MDFFSPPPTPPNSGNPGTFNDDADAFLGWFPAFVAELNALLPYLTGAGFGDGTAAAPGLFWRDDPDTGLFRSGSNTVGVTAGGILRLTVSALALTSTVPLRAPLGTAAAPGISFETDPNTGIRSDGADVLHFITGGATRGFFSTSYFQSTLPAVVPVGAAATPSLTFAGDLDTGIFRAAADLLGIAAGGEERFRVGSGRAAALVPFSVPDGTQAFPGLTFNGEVGSNTGFFLAAENEIGVTCQGTERARFTPSGMQLQGLLSGTAVTQTDQDTTPGRLLKVGDYGLGGTARPIPGNDADQISVTGFYQVAGNTLNRPAGMTIGTLQHIQHGASRAIQIAYPQTASDTGRWCRYKDTTWGGWFLTYDQRNVIGTVAQSAGLPTGALIERGSNANGDYTRYADGTQICTIAAIDLPYLVGAGGAVCQGDWTFPASFVSIPAVTALLNGPATQGATAPTLEMLGAVMWMNSGAPTVSARLTLRRNAGQTNFVAGNAARALATAIGRWF
ncbi:pyocin knob domain-containing protein [Cereibacter sphaeroides]|uniref:pyocin knob domain-containing protein n=1 Tax=Cereibacter sphaeroides TaxID=1063 RepID=UPI001E568FFD|nr:pyocin knob domain-containing protein [Cereibacter sphaeroides]